LLRPGKTVEPGEVTQDQVSKEDQKIMDSITAQYEKDVANAGTYITRELDKKGRSRFSNTVKRYIPKS
jgi:hypothetical protein